MNEHPIHSLAIPCSLGRSSYSTMLLKAAKQLAKLRVEVDIDGSAARIPLFNEDSEGDLTPGPVLELCTRTRSSAAVLIASPEYNGSITGVFKNMIDRASRPYGQSAFAGKLVSMVDASPLCFGALSPGSRDRCPYECGSNGRRGPTSGQAGISPGRLGWSY